MNNHKFAALDIGTNTILMVLAESNGTDGIKILRDVHSIARLGEKVDKNKYILPEAADRAKKVFAEYKKICDEYGIETIRAVATSAMRDAENKDDIAGELGKIIGVPIEIIPGDYEAQLSFAGTADSILPTSVIDIGGGSTEYISGENGKMNFKISTSLGCVRLTERFFSSQPPNIEEIEKCRTFISQELSKIDKSIFAGTLYASAGTATTLAAAALSALEFEENKVHGYLMSLENINNILNDFLNSDLDRLINHFNILPKRADLITAGALVLSESMKYLGYDTVTICAHGLRYGILYDTVKKYFTK